MRAFLYEPSFWPPEASFSDSAAPEVLQTMRRIREGYMVSGRRFRLLCGAILEEYGLPDAINQGSCLVLIDFFRFASARHKRAAERVAWREFYGPRLYCPPSGEMELAKSASGRKKL